MFDEVYKAFMYNNFLRPVNFRTAIEQHFNN